MRRQATQKIALFLIGFVMFSTGFLLSVYESLELSDYAMGCAPFGSVPSRANPCRWWGYDLSTMSPHGFWILIIPFAIGMSMILSRAYPRLGWFLSLAR